MNHEFPRHFESERLLLRCYRPGDGKWYYAMSLRNREHLLPFETDNPAVNLNSEDEAENLMAQLEAEWIAQNCFFIGAFEKKSGEFATQIYVGPLDWSLPEFQIGYFADVDHEGMGFVTEGVRATLLILFNTMAAHRVRLGCDETNLRSIAVAERCGMTLEGRLRENRRKTDGTYSNSLIYGLLKQEFQPDLVK